MALTLSDIDRWDPDAVLAIFHAGSARANAAGEARDGLGSLSAFKTWDGDAAAAAETAVGKVRKDLDDHGAEALAVAQAANKAAGEIRECKFSLAAIRADAAVIPATIDPVAGSVTPLVTTGPKAAGAALDAGLLREAIKTLIAKAETADADLANAINMVSGKTSIPAGPHDSRPDIQKALSEPLPTDPTKFHDLWTQLTPEEKNWIYDKDHSLGNHAGMPFVDKDHYNRIHLPELEQQARSKLAGIVAEHPDWENGHGKGTRGYGEWKKRYDAAARNVQGLETVDKTASLNDGKTRFLSFVDGKGHAALSVGNPDTAKDNITLVPGTGQDLSRIDNADGKAGALRDAALRADPSLSAKDVSVTTWMGYDRPMDLPHAALTRYATGGADSLDTFQDGLRASHQGSPSFNTVIGHSYGSTLVGAAASDGHHLDADRVIAVGSPGMLVDHASDLSLAPHGEVYSSRADHDIIMYAEGATLGPSPARTPDFGGNVFDSNPGDVGGPSWLRWMGLPSISAHSSYFDPGSAGLLNMGQIATGQEPNHKAQ